MDDAAILTSADAVRARYAEPSHMAKAKQLDRLDKHCIAFIALAPMVIVASSDASGRLDCTARGDAPGFVAVLDDKTLVIPDRKGNNRVDTMLNVVENPHLGLLFLVPGINETLRVNGPARIVTDPALLAPLAANGKVPDVGVVVTADEVFFHCAKPLIRSQFWDPSRHVARSSFPTLGRILADQISGNADEFDAGINEKYRTQLY